MTVIFGNLTGTFQGFVLGGLSDSFDKLSNRHILYFIYLAIGEFVFAYISTALSIYTREHIMSKIRRQHLRAIPKQNFGFFDELGAGEITTRITADTNLVQEAISENWTRSKRRSWIPLCVRYWVRQVLETHPYLLILYCRHHNSRIIGRSLHAYME
jgi:ABC-type multidrug transport system fused ATPase/permease subunit